MLAHTPPRSAFSSLSLYSFFYFFLPSFTFFLLFFCVTKLHFYDIICISKQGFFPKEFIMKKTVYIPFRVNDDFAKILDDYSLLMFGYVNRSRTIRVLLESIISRGL